MNSLIDRKDSLRLRGFDYSWPRVYFVTIVCYRRSAKFDDERVARATIDCLKNLRAQLTFNIYIYCLMPDHFRALLSPGKSKKPLGAICGAFKSLSTHS